MRMYAYVLERIKSTRLKHKRVLYNQINSSTQRHSSVAKILFHVTKVADRIKEDSRELKIISLVFAISVLVFPSYMRKDLFHVDNCLFCTLSVTGIYNFLNCRFQQSYFYWFMITILVQIKYITLFCFPTIRPKIKQRRRRYFSFIFTGSIQLVPFIYRC